jgi:hypothetical protein
MTKIVPRNSNFSPTYEVNDAAAIDRNLQHHDPIGYITDLMIHYCLDLEGKGTQAWIGQWLVTYPREWLCLAVIEALYQGRYKAISVEQILAAWLRRQRPVYHFSNDFERLISRRLPRRPALPPSRDLPATAWGQRLLLPAASSPVSAALPAFLRQVKQHILGSENQAEHSQGLSSSALVPLRSTMSSEETEATSTQIDHFMPATAPSRFYSRLKAVMSDVTS